MALNSLNKIKYNLKTLENVLNSYNKPHHQLNKRNFLKGRIEKEKKQQ